ncbi:MAG: exosortase system-associated protein, TIGR04073 family [Verrucomicrobia bacterium]|nr:exosortase system-associated protein, TIGR04073 family [Verrucomicrobiota bacterium]MBV9658563.1 exosortase system-associated protein, TIGR04073 family [Verrucomicrobiota bacterium]
MKSVSLRRSLLAASCFLALGATVARADIQQPPGAEQGPTRKLGRAIANLGLGFLEVPDTIGQVNEDEGNAAAWTYGVIRGFGRGFARTGAGFYELLFWPFPLTKSTYRPVLRPNVPWIRSGYQEFPPELAWESRYQYARATNGE